jgi:methionyl-tRNA formyltransferase
MGTPAFAVPTLERLLAEQEVVAVFTQPDRPAGRGRRLRSSPVKALAAERGVPVLQPASLRREPEALAALLSFAPEVIVVAAYGLILPPPVLAAAPGGALNVHASLLPRWRGAAPVAHAIPAGDEETGVTIMQIEAGLDTGPMLARRAVAIGPEETTGELTHRLAELGAALLAEVLVPWLADELVAAPQVEAAATYAPRLTADDAALDWSAPAAALARRVRAMSPAPGAFSVTAGGERLKVYRARALRAGPGLSAPPGTLVATEGGPAVVAGDGLLQLDEVQLAGGRRMAAAALLRGRPALLGERLASPEAERVAPRPA